MLIFPASAAIPSISWSNTCLCAYSREPAVQHWPILKKIALAVPRIATSMSASGNTIAGDFPPSSSDTFFKLPAAACTISLPTSVDPVNATLSTSGCAANAAPAVSPKPVTMFTTLGGNPTSWINRPSRTADSGVCSAAGFSTIVQPAASAGASFHAAIISGKFHGMIWPTTPTGSRSV